MSEKFRTVFSSILAVSLVVSVMTVSGYACFAGAKNDDIVDDTQYTYIAD